jgi:hypothetical protein
VREAVQKRFLFPGRFAVGGVGDDGAFGIAAAETFDDPDQLDIHHVRVKDARRDQPVHEQRLGLVHAEPVDDAVLLGIQPRADRLGEGGMIGQCQDRFHRASDGSIAFTGLAFSTAARKGQSNLDAAVQILKSLAQTSRAAFNISRIILIQPMKTVKYMILFCLACSTAGLTFDLHVEEVWLKSQKNALAATATAAKAEKMKQQFASADENGKTMLFDDFVKHIQNRDNLISSSIVSSFHVAQDAARATYAFNFLAAICVFYLLVDKQASVQKSPSTPASSPH